LIGVVDVFSYFTRYIYNEARNNLWSMRNDIENFQYGLKHKLHKNEGWLWQRLVEEGLVSDTQENLREKFPERVPVNKGKNIIDDITMAAQYFTPKRLFMQHEMEQFTASKEGKCATPEGKQKHRAFLKEQFKVLPADVLEVYVKASRERMAYHGFIEEAIVHTLNDNNEQAFRQLDKVQITFLFSKALICTNFILSSM
jgi:hypothetical protein